jgi:5-methyltetrahydrofolate--homocysteine methyltransferase
MTAADILQPVIPIPDIPAWSAQLRQLSHQPLELVPDLPEIAARCEAWWAHDCLDRPVFTGSANLNPARPVTRRLELLDQPDEWFAAKRADMLQRHRVGETLPTVRVELPFQGGVLGNDFGFYYDTVWTHPSILGEWTSGPEWVVHEGNRWWEKFGALTKLVASDARGRYPLMSPGVGMGSDTLSGMRGPQQLCLDLIERPEVVRAAVDSFYPAWNKLFAHSYRAPMSEGVGLVQNIGLWSSRPYITPQCDFAFMISTRHFEELFLPEIARQAATVGRACFHLDGPGVARHIDAILDVPDIQAIQWVPGASASPLPWAAMLQKIQRRGRSLQVICPPEDVLPVCDALKPEGLNISLSGSLRPDELDDLFAQFCRRYR